jgi:hypothetical protein
VVEESLGVGDGRRFLGPVFGEREGGAVSVVAARSDRDGAAIPGEGNPTARGRD